MIGECKKQIIGKMVRLKREEKGFTQLETAQNTELSRSYISDIENGRYMPSVDTLTRIATFLRIDLNFLVQNDGNTSNVLKEGEQMSKLKRLRLIKNLSQTELSDLSGVKQNFISEIESGIKNGSIKTLNSLAKALEVQISDLVENHQN